MLNNLLKILPTIIFDLFQDTKRTLTLLLEECGETVRVAAFESLLANMSHEMAKGQLIHVQWGSEIRTSRDFNNNCKVL